ncbi:unnamed protein product [Somion occarium]|uniref:G-protein coupled receptors family 2 profile 2 domain-containing protein n=1 Tax=Somion occarium TaxID=3059160 RepID=A0ABP1DSW2_9APHY
MADFDYATGLYDDLHPHANSKDFSYSRFSMFSPSPYHSDAFSLHLPRFFSRRSFPDGGANWKIYFYFIMQLVGGVGLTVLLATMLWPTKPRRPRNPLLLSLCFSWWISTFPCLLLLYYANQVTGPPPTPDICLASAVLTMGQSILVATTAPALVFNVWLIIKTTVTSTFDDARWVRWTTRFCLVLPYVMFVTFGMAAFGLGRTHPELVHRATFYCIVDDRSLTTALGALGTVAMIVTSVFEIWIVYLLRTNQSRLKQLIGDGRGLCNVSLVVRVIIFGFYVLLGLCLNIISIFDWTSPIPDLFFSTFGIAVVVVFGSQRDIWHIWMTFSRNLASSASNSKISFQGTPTSPLTPNPPGLLSHQQQSQTQPPTPSTRRTDGYVGRISAIFSRRSSQMQTQTEMQTQTQTYTLPYTRGSRSVRSRKSSAKGHEHSLSSPLPLPTKLSLSDIQRPLPPIPTPPLPFHAHSFSLPQTRRSFGFARSSRPPSRHTPTPTLPRTHHPHSNHTRSRSLGLSLNNLTFGSFGSLRSLGSLGSLGSLSRTAGFNANRSPIKRRFGRDAGYEGFDSSTESVVSFTEGGEMSGYRTTQGQDRGEVGFEMDSIDFPVEFRDTPDVLGRTGFYMCEAGGEEGGVVEGSKGDGIRQDVVDEARERSLPPLPAPTPTPSSLTIDTFVMSTLGIPRADSPDTLRPPKRVYEADNNRWRRQM